MLPILAQTVLVPRKTRQGPMKLIFTAGKIRYLEQRLPDLKSGSRLPLPIPPRVL
jgi:hypothetical protein